MRTVNSVLDLTPKQIEEIFDRTAELKRQHAIGYRPQILQGRVLTQIFEKPSLRTRVSFEAAMMQLGGDSIFLLAKDVGIGQREAVQDVARVLGSYSDVIALRTFSQELIDEFVQHAGVPIINGLSDDRHPCQALTDLFTIREHLGSLDGKKLVFVGDGNNVARSLASGCAIMGTRFTLCTPDKYRLKDEQIHQIKSRFPQAHIEQTSSFKKALEDCDIVYTDVWTSMGQENEEAERQQKFQPFQVNAELMKLAPPNCRFLHCLPAKRGREVTDEVLDGPQSLAFIQAENRMHVAKGILVWILDSSDSSTPK